MILRKNKWILPAILLVVSIIAIILSIRYGAVDMTLSQVINGIFRLDDSNTTTIIYNIRLPRTLAAVLIGTSLAVAGSLLQAVLNNPLADPYSMGISSGAALAAYLIILVFPNQIHLLMPATFLGASLVAFLVYSVAWKQGITPVRLILSGVAVSSFLSAISSTLALIYPDRLQGAVSFMIGGLSAISWSQLRLVWLYLIIGLVAALIIAPRINLLLLGDSTAKSLGVRVELLRAVATLIATLLTACAVSLAGLIGFVGLIVPHICRVFVGNDYRILIPSSILLGSALLVACDTFGRVAFAPAELPVGIIMGVIGAPFFLFLLRRSKL